MQQQQQSSLGPWDVAKVPSDNNDKPCPKSKKRKRMDKSKEGKKSQSQQEKQPPEASQGQ